MRILIVGGSSDLGISLAKYLTSLNNEVIITYHKNKINLDNIKTIKLDITKEAEIAKTISKLGKIDLLINMASISKDNLFMNITKKDFQEVLETNLIGPFLTSKIYSKYNSGTIINISSTDGIDTYNEYNILYASSKAALINLSKSMSLSIKNKVICICPNWIDSNSTNEMDKTYLDKELKRIKQTRLITKAEFNKCIIDSLKYESGSVIRIDVRDDKLWIVKES